MSELQILMGTLVLLRRITSKFHSVVPQPAAGRRIGRSSNSWYHDPYFSYSLTYVIFRGEEPLGLWLRLEIK